MSIDHFGFFVLAVFLLNITPGNDFIYVATRSISQGAKAGIISAFGISSGLLVHVTASVMGLSVLLAKSILAYEIIKYVGAAYLVYIGVRMLFAKTAFPEGLSGSNGEETRTLQLLRQGFITNVFNPKVALFFLSFLPQFANQHSAYVSLQLLVLGLWFIFSGTVVSIAIAIAFARMRNWLASMPLFWKFQQRIASTIFIGLGLKIALEGDR